MTRRRRTRLLTVLALAAACTVGPTATVLFCLGGIASIAAYMDLHGFAAAMRIAVVGAVASVIIPPAWWICAVVNDRPRIKAQRAQLRALRAETRATQSSSPVRHRKVA